MQDESARDRAIDDQIQQALARLSSAIEKYKPIAVFGLFSGGHDSFTASYIASLHSAFTSVVHINTGTGIPLTRDYVYKTANARKWPLLEYKATENTNAKGEPDPQIYADAREFVNRNFPSGSRNEVSASDMTYLFESFAKIVARQCFKQQEAEIRRLRDALERLRGKCGAGHVCCASTSSIADAALKPVTTQTV